MTNHLAVATLGDVPLGNKSPENPRKRSGLTIDEDGDKIVVTIRQSWLGNYLHVCPHRALAEAAGWVPESKDSDAAAVGTAVHAGIEAMELLWQQHPDELRVWGVPGAYDLGMSEALNAFDIEVQAGNVEWVKYTEDKAYKLIGDAIHNWWSFLMPNLGWSGPPVGVEQAFDLPVSEGIILLDGRTLDVRFRGTMDSVYLFPGLYPVEWNPTVRVVDWKTTGRPFQRRQKEKFGVQPPVYVLAAEHLFPAHNVDPSFTYAVMLHENKNFSQALTVPVSSGWIDWTVEQAVNVATLVATFGLDTAASLAARNDSSALCSPVWCPLFHKCKPHAFSGAMEFVA